MKKVFLLVIGAFVLIAAGVLFAASRQPEAYHVERSVVTNAAPISVYAVLQDFRRFGEWSPWEELDPAMKRTFEGPETGVGSIYKWDGNDKVGAGKMTITGAEPNAHVDVALEFLRPFPSSSQVRWSVAPEGGGSKVTWAMDGKNDTLVAKAFSLFVDMDAMLGKDFEKGLAKLKTVAEKS